MKPQYPHALAGQRAASPPQLAAHRLARRMGWAAGVFGLVLAILLFAPARWLTSAVGQASQGQLVLANAKGTVWGGRADLLLTGGAGSRDAAALPQGLDWQMRPGWDAGPVMRVWLNAPCCMAQPMAGRLQPGWGRATVALMPHQSQWPTTLLNGLGTPWNTLQLDGTLRLLTPGLQMQWHQGRMTVSGTLQVDALAMASRLSTLRPMGSYRLQLKADDSQTSPTLLLSTIDGALHLRGEGQWVGGRLRFAGEAEAREGAEAALSNLLNIVGRRSGNRSRIALG